MEELGIDVGKRIYEVKGISAQEYENDRRLDEVIVTLRSDTDTIYIPSRYIRTTPISKEAGASWLVATFDFGPVADDIDLQPVLDAMKLAASDFLGYLPSEEMVNVPTNDVITPDQAQRIEEARVQMKSVIRKDIYAMYKDTLQRLEVAKTRGDVLEQICRDNGYFP
jgi:hypothetical protein